MSRRSISPMSPCYVSPKSTLREQDDPNLSRTSRFAHEPVRADTMWSLSARSGSDPSGRASPGTHPPDRAGPSRSASYEVSGNASSNNGPTYSMSRGSNRRASRFDPMGSNDEEEDEYEDLGCRHPLRRVNEEGREDGLNLPSIKSLFGPGGDLLQSASWDALIVTVDGQGTPNPSGPVPPHRAPILPPLVPPSPSSSPSTAYRSSRFSSLVFLHYFREWRRMVGPRVRAGTREG
jgi:hypothetical protein